MILKNSFLSTNFEAGHKPFPKDIVHQRLDSADALEKNQTKNLSL